MRPPYHVGWVGLTLRWMSKTTTAILPGGTVGVLGSGQLGRMFAIAARRMGYRVHTFSPDDDTPTGQVADEEVEEAEPSPLSAIRSRRCLPNPHQKRCRSLCLAASR